MTIVKMTTGMFTKFLIGLINNHTHTLPQLDWHCYVYPSSNHPTEVDEIKLTLFFWSCHPQNLSFSAQPIAKQRSTELYARPNEMMNQ